MSLAPATLVPVCDASDREAWLAARRKFLTASEVACALGLTSGRARLIRAKAGKSTPAEIKEAEGIGELAQVAAGRHLEAGIFEWFKSETPHVDAGMCGLLFASRSEPRLAATPDAMMDGAPVELKCVGESALPNWHDAQATHGWEKFALEFPEPVDVRLRLPMENNRITPGARDPRSEWRRSRSHQLQVILPTLGPPRGPLKYVIQLQVQMHVLGAETGWLVGLVGGTRRYDLLYERDRKLERVILAETKRFWADVAKERA